MVMVAAAFGAIAAAPPGAGPQADPEARRIIEETVAAIVHQEETAPARIEELRRLGAARRGDLLLQIALYLAESDGTERSMAGALIFHELGFTPAETIGAVLPHLETADPRLRRVLTEMLGSIDRREGGEPDFGVYAAWLTARGGTPPAALVTYLYEASPVEAARCMRRVYGAPGSPDPAAAALEDLRGILSREDVSRAWTDRERALAREAVEKLSRDPAWWNRRCAAAALRRHPDLGTPEIRKRLREDPDPLARGPRTR